MHIGNEIDIPVRRAVFADGFLLGVRKGNLHPGLQARCADCCGGVFGGMIAERRKRNLAI